MAELDRRRVLQLLTAFGVSLGVPGLSPAQSSACGSALAKGLNMEAVRKIGSEYLAAYPQDMALSNVRLLLDVEASAHPSSMEKLRELMRADFAAGRMVTLSGWFLSATEARIFAGLATAC